MNWIRSCFIVMIGFVTAAQAADRKFFSGYAGTIPPRDSDKARTYFVMPRVRALLAELETGTLPAEVAEKKLADSGATLQDLLRVRLLRRDGERVAIGFAYFTADDMRRVYAVADRLAPSLAAAYVARKKDFDRIFDSYPVPTVPRDQIAFILLAGFCLNWDGLVVTKEFGYRRPLWVEGKDFRYSFWASESIGGRSYREVYWGSSTFPGPGPAADPHAYSFSSFGDADSDPRMNLPDLLYLERDEMPTRVRNLADRVGLHAADAFGQHFKSVLGDLNSPVSAMLFALRNKPRSEADLESVIGRDPRPLLSLMEEIQYVKRRDGLVQLTVPVFDQSNKALVDQTISLSRAIMRAWLDEHYPEIKQDLSTLVAVRMGVPFEALFTQVWHEIFGLVTRELALRHMIASAYADGVGYKGSFSVLWRQSLYSFTPG
jgi:hypothetical protein